MKNDRALLRRDHTQHVACRRFHRSRGVLLVGVLAAVLLFLAGPGLSSPAAAASQFVFAGRGNGHAAGMSQWGAWQGAREGNSYQQILAFYYPGTELDSADPGTILKVRISSTPWTSNTTVYSRVRLEPVAAPATLRLYTSASKYSTADLAAGAAVQTQRSGGKVRVTVDGESQGSFNLVEMVPDGVGSSAGRVRIALTTGGGTAIDPREYWGTIRVQPGEDTGDLWVYNFVDLEKYVRSIAEVDYDWATVGGDYYAPEAVKAQAVASRSYAVAKNGATLADNWADQCYRGYSFEAKYPGIAKAAEATAGEILTFQGEAITAFFSGHSGGYTSTSGWSGAKPAYLVSQPDPWSLKAPPSGVGKGPGWAWSYTISADSLSGKVNGRLKDISGKTVDVGTISQVEVVARDTDDRNSHATRLRITGGEGSATVSVLSFRSLLGTSNLPSTLILTINGDPGAGTAGGGADSGGTGGSGGDAGNSGGGDVAGGDAGGSGGDAGGSGGDGLMPGEFYDVGPNHLYHDEISRVVTAELMGGYENGLFRPEGSVTRGQFAKIAVSLHNLTHTGEQIVVVNVTAKPFDDVPIDSKKTGDISDWIAAAKSAGLVSGINDTEFSPYAEIRRDQMATMICRALGWDDEAAALPAGTPGFADVSPTSPHWDAATYLKQQGILLGYGGSDDGSMELGAAEPIKRQHLAVLLCRVLDLEE